MLSVFNFHVSIGDKPIRKGLTLDAPVAFNLEGSVG